MRVLYLCISVYFITTSIGFHSITLLKVFMKKLLRFPDPRIIINLSIPIVKEVQFIFGPKFPNVSFLPFLHHQRIDFLSHSFSFAVCLPKGDDASSHQHISFLPSIHPSRPSSARLNFIPFNPIHLLCIPEWRLVLYREGKWLVLVEDLIIFALLTYSPTLSCQI